ncbi:MAG: hypothetical protein AAF211_25375, partial [Myxococcota bacterium]
MPRTLFLVCGLLACAGDDSIAPRDTGTPEIPTPTGSTGTLDTGSPLPDPTLGTVTVMVSGAIGPGPATVPDGIVMSVAAPDGTFVFAAELGDDDQVVLEDVPVGGSVSLVGPLVSEEYAGNTMTTRAVRTVFAVQDGDTLQFGDRLPVAAFNGGSQVSIMMDAVPGIPSASATVNASCGGFSSVSSLPIGDLSFRPFSSCLGAPIELLATAYETFGSSRAVGFAPLTVELDGDLMGSGMVSAWSTEHGVVRLSPVPDLMDETYSTEVLGQFGTSGPDLGKTGFDGPPQPI